MCFPVACLYVAGGEDRFEVDAVTGVVRTKGNERFPYGKEYEIGVSQHKALFVVSENQDWILLKPACTGLLLPQYFSLSLSLSLTHTLSVCLSQVFYEIGVSAQDVSVMTLQRSPTHSLKIFVGERDPQFYPQTLRLEKSTCQG